MRPPAFFPDHRTLAKILKEDVNLPYDEWKEKVDKPIKPILNKINESIRDLVPSFQKFHTYQRSAKKSIQGRLCNSKIQWKYDNSHLPLNKNVSMFVQFSDYREDKRDAVFWGIEWWGASNKSEEVYQILKKVNCGGKLIKDTEGRGAKGTTILLVKNKYTADQLLNLERDLIKEIAEDIKNIVRKIDVISIPQKGNYTDYLPNKRDFEKAYRTIASLGEHVMIGDILRQIEFDMETSGHKLKNDWRIEIERKIKIWSSKEE